MNSGRKCEKPWNKPVTSEQEFARYENFVEEWLVDDDLQDAFQFRNEYLKLSLDARKRLFAMIRWLMER